MTKINSFVRWWMTPKLPVQHIYGVPSGGLFTKCRILIARWFFHPIKRRIAKMYLHILRSITGIKVIGITGSAGKTTTKEMLVAILKFHGKTVFSKENIDPIYNIPQTILQTSFDTKYLILEMGVEYPGEMDFYLWLAKPDIGVLTNIYPTHTEYFGDAGGVFAEKSKLAYGIDKSGTVVANSEDGFLSKLRNKLKAKIVWFGHKSEVSASNFKITQDFKSKFLLSMGQNEIVPIDVELSVPGRQFVQNALASAAVSYDLNISKDIVKRGLESFSSAPHRMKILKHKSGALIIDDSYNNNPQAALETINTFNEYAGTRAKVVIFGDMLELGQLSDKYHKKVGEILGKSNLKKLICVGENSKITAKVAGGILGESRVQVASSLDEVFDFLQEFLKKDVVVLVKGSRSIHLEKIIERL